MQKIFVSKDIKHIDKHLKAEQDILVKIWRMSRAGVLKLFNQGAGARMKWQAVICGCLVSPPNPRGAGGGRGVL